jgi:sugar lactone lactonase YvrE
MRPFFILKRDARQKEKGMRKIWQTVILVFFGLLAAAPVQAQNLFVATGSAGGPGYIYEYTPGGFQTTFASGLNGPSSLALDSSGNLFEADYGSGNIYKFTPGGARTTFATGLPARYGTYGPTGMAFDGAGNLFVGYYGQILEYAPDGTSTMFARGLYPEGLAFDSDGNLFAATSALGPGPYIYKFAPDGTQSTFATFGSGNSPACLAVDKSGNLFESDVNMCAIYRFTPGGMMSTFASLNVQAPEGLAFDGTGNMFEADWSSGRVLEFTPSGSASVFATGLNRPAALAFQPTPEPATLTLLAWGTLSLLRRKK